MQAELKVVDSTINNLGMDQQLAADISAQDWFNDQMSQHGLFIGTWISGYYTQYVGVRADVTHGSPDTAFDAYLDNGFMYMSTSLTWNCTTTGSFPISERTTTEVFYLLEGITFLL